MRLFKDKNTERYFFLEGSELVELEEIVECGAPVVKLKKEKKEKRGRGRSKKIERRYRCEECEAEFISTVEPIDAVCHGCKSLRVKVL